MKNKILYQGFHSIEQILDRGKTYEKVNIKNAVSGIVVDSVGRIALVTQYRPALNEVTFEIPAGLLDKDKTITEILAEELQEECNINPDNILFISQEPVLHYHPIGGSSDCCNSIYIVKLDTKGIDQEIENDDVNNVIWVTVRDIEILINHKLIKDAKTIMAFYYIKAMRGVL